VKANSLRCVRARLDISPYRRNAEVSHEKRGPGFDAQFKKEKKKG